MKVFSEISLEAIQLTYCDKDNDWIALNNEEDLRIALDYAKNEELNELILYVDNENDDQENQETTSGLRFGTYRIFFLILSKNYNLYGKLLNLVDMFC